MSEGTLGKFADGVLLTRGNHKVLGLVMLEHQPHTLYVVTCVAPVTQSIEVTQIELILLSCGNTGCSKGDFPRNEGLPSALTLMVE